MKDIIQILIFFDFCIYVSILALTFYLPLYSPFINPLRGLALVASLVFFVLLMFDIPTKLIF